MHDIANYQENANQNHNDIYHLTTVRMAFIKKTKDVLERMWGKGNPCAQWVNMLIAIAITKKYKDSKKIKNRTIIWSSIPTSGDISKEMKSESQKISALSCSLQHYSQ